MEILTHLIAIVSGAAVAGVPLYIKLRTFLSQQRTDSIAEWVVIVKRLEEEVTELKTARREADQTIKLLGEQLSAVTIEKFEISYKYKFLSDRYEILIKDHESLKADFEALKLRVNK